MKTKMAIVTFVITTLLCVLFLCSSLMLPQEAIQHNIEASLEQFNNEGEKPFVYDHTADANRLDNTTDVLMIMQSYYSCEWESLWKNSWNKHENGLIAGLNEAILEGASPNYTYSRYWAGCRTSLRMLLSFFSYTEIRHITALAFFGLFLLSALCVYKHSDGLYAFAFSLSVILMRPEVISNSLQFSCCYIIGFAAMCLIPAIMKRTNTLVEVFIVIGCLTQFFDYYTTPLITFAYPFMMVLLQKRDANTKEKLTLFLKAGCAWLFSWVAMWLVKLALTSLFTDESAFAKALWSVSRRFGFMKIQGVEDTYNPLMVFYVAFRTFIQSPRLLVVFCGIVVLMMAVGVRCYKPQIRIMRQNWQSNLVFLLIAMLPMIWFACTCSPTILHIFFQYRSLSVTIFAGFVWIFDLMKSSSQ